MDSESGRPARNKRVDHFGSRPEEAYGWDPFGNRTADNTSPQGTNTTGPSGRLLADSVSTYSHDGEGRLTQARNKSTGDVTTYSWSTQGQLLKVTLPWWFDQHLPV